VTAAKAKFSDASSNSALVQGLRGGLAGALEGQKVRNRGCRGDRRPRRHKTAKATTRQLIRFPMRLPQPVGTSLPIAEA
jgi:hypothetical protein